MVWRARAEHDATLGAEVARQAATALAGLLASQGMTRKDLADAMRVSSGRVSQILSGDENLTIRSLAAVAHALQANVEISFHGIPPRHQGSPSDTDSPTYDPVSPFVPSAS